MLTVHVNFFSTLTIYHTIEHFISAVVIMTDPLDFTSSAYPLDTPQSRRHIKVLLKKMKKDRLAQKASQAMSKKYLKPNHHLK